MHSIEELERQFKAACDKSLQARRAEREALDRLHKAMGEKLIADFEAMGGVIGVTRVRPDESWSQSEGPFLVMGWEKKAWSGGVQYKLAKIKKDGTPSNAPSVVTAGKVIIRPEDQPNA